MRFSTFILVIFFSSFFYSFSQVYEINGKILDLETCEAIQGAVIYDSVNHISVLSQKDGFFKYQCNQIDKMIRVSFLGYETSFIKSSTEFLNIKLKPALIYSEEIIIEGNKSNSLLSVHSGINELSRKELKNIPFILGERDPLKALQLMPGVAKSEAGQGLNIRGGNVDQNLVLLDQATIYNPSHLMSVFSSINPLIMSNIKMYKGSMPSEFGGRLSSVIDIQTLDPDLYQKHGEANIGLILSNIHLSTPLVNSKVGASVSFRRSYIDEMVKPAINFLVNEKNFKKIGYYFYDLNAKVLYKINDRSSVSTFFFQGQDYFQLNDKEISLTNQLNWGNQVAGIQWKIKINDQWQMTNTFYQTQYKFQFDASQDAVNFKLNGNIDEYSIKNNQIYIDNNYKFNYGFHLGYTRFLPFRSKAVSGNINANFGASNNYHTRTGAVFFEIEKELFHRALIEAGIRLSAHQHFGPFKSFKRDLLDQVYDTIDHPKNEILYKHFKPELRLSARYQLNDLSSMKLSFTENYQTVLQLSSTSVSMPMDFYIPASKDIPSQYSYQISGGYTLQSSDQKFEFSVEPYFKNMMNQTELVNGLLNTLTRSTIEDNIVYGQMISKGVEFILFKNKGRTTGWVSYTYSKSEKKFLQINQGIPYRSKYDRPHDLTLVAVHQLNRRVSLSAIFIYASGTAFTMPNGRYVIQGNLLNQYGQVNSYRLPNYHRLDLSLTYQLKKTDLIESEINFSVYNVYNRNNTFYIFVKTLGDFDRYKVDVKLDQTSILPILPSITYLIKF